MIALKLRSKSIKYCNIIYYVIKYYINKGIVMAEKKKWIKDAISKPGALRKSLHVKKGEKITEKKLEKSEHSKNPKTRKRAVLAKTLRNMHK